jgi:hypothetical protein
VSTRSALSQQHVLRVISGRTDRYQSGRTGNGVTLGAPLEMSKVAASTCRRLRAHTSAGKLD